MNPWRATRETRDFLLMFGPNDPQNVKQPARVGGSRTEGSEIRTVVYVNTPIVREELVHSIREHLSEVTKVELLDQGDPLGHHCALAIYRHVR